jgi:sporulation related protein
MADRYPNRPFPADDYGRGGDQHGSGEDENDPLAELARLIGQTDPFAAPGRANPPPRAAGAREQRQPPYQQPQHQESYEEDELPPAGRPQWIQRANIQRQQETPPPIPYDEGEEYPSQNYQAQEYPGTVHPLHRYAAQAGAQQDDDHEASYEQAEEHADPSRYDEALYGQIGSGAQDFQRDPAYPDDPYAYQDGYDEDQEEQRPKRRGGLLMIAAVLALAVVGTGAAFAYRTFVGSPRSGEPPIIKADNSPTKVAAAAPSDGSGKTLDRMPSGDGAEKLVPREETPVDVNTRAAGPRVVFPPLNANNNPPSPASVSPSTMPPNVAPGAPSNGTMVNSEPRKVRTFSVHGDQGDNAAAAVTAAPGAPAPSSAKQAAATRAIPPPAAPRGAPAPGGNAPMSLSPDSAQASLPPPEPRTRAAAAAPAQTASTSDTAAEGRFMVQVSSQKTEADAQASFRALQKKFPDALGSQSPLIKRADLGDKGTVYRAMVGPFASRDEAVKFCMSYKSAGGQCYIP